MYKSKDINRDTLIKALENAKTEIGNNNFGYALFLVNSVYRRLNETEYDQHTDLIKEIETVESICNQEGVQHMAVTHLKEAIRLLNEEQETIPASPD